jgi:hypothetical protein
MNSTADDRVVALVTERFRLEAMVEENTVGDNDPLIEATAQRIGRLDTEIAGMVATSAAAIVGQVRVLHELGYGTFSDEDQHHPDGIADKLIATIAAGVERLAASTG